MKKSEARSAGQAASELRKIADLLERIKVNPKGRPHPEIATIAADLKAIRIELGKSVRAGAMSESSQRAIADGFTNIGNALGTKA
jgi:hypothetical protein